MQYLPNIIFAVILVLAVGYFTRNIKKLIRNIKLGQKVDASNNKAQRWKNTARIALGQSKMVKRPISGFMHVIVYVGFVVINLEVLEIIIDGIFGTHRIGLKVLPQPESGKRSSNCRNQSLRKFTALPRPRVVSSWLPVIWP